MNVYWFESPDRPGNFGDRLTPLILDHLGIKYRRSPPGRAHLVGAGSLIEHLPEDFRGVIWTTGMLFKSTRRNFPHAQVVAVRGRLTLERLQCPNHDEVGLGDGGLLAHVFHRPGKKKFKLGLVPHYVDFGDPVLAAIRSTSREIAVIDVCRDPREVIQAIGECERVLSSSLHGLVVADSLRIPGCWMELNHGIKKVLGEGFKFRDHLSIFGLTDAQPVHPTPADNLDTLLPLFDNYARPGLDAIQQKLLRSLDTLAGIPPTIHARQRVPGTGEPGEPLPELRRTLERLVPRDKKFLLVDENQLRDELADARAIPFLEKNGVYWGPPDDDATAVAELERLRQAGADFIVFAWPAFWWLTHYQKFAVYLRTNYRCMLKNERLEAFDLRTTDKAGRPADSW